MADNKQQTGSSPGTQTEVPWYVKMEQESEQIAQQIEHDAEEASHLSQTDMAAYNKDGDLSEKWASEKAAEDAKEKERDAKLAAEIAQERMEFAVQQGELRTADDILAKNPSLIETDQNMMIPNGKDPELKAETTF